MKRISLKTKIVTGAAVVALTLGGTAAYAFFTSTGSGTGSATVGTASPWTVDTIVTSGGPLYPGAGTETVTYHVTNGNNSAQMLNAVNVVLDGGPNVLDANNANAAVAGCLKADFVVTDSNPGLAGSVAASGVYTVGSATITMTNTIVSQNACQGVHPAFHVNAT